MAKIHGECEMKKLLAFKFSLILLSILFPALLYASESKFPEGKYYSVVKTIQQTKKPTVTEFFSYYCSHCFKFENYFNYLKTVTPKNTQFKKIYFVGIGGDKTDLLQKSYLSSVLLGVSDKVSARLFNLVQTQRKPPRNQSEMIKVFENIGISKENFLQAYNSFSVETIAHQDDKIIEKSKVNAVPKLLINNKYLINTKFIKTKKQYTELINYLLTKK